MSHKLVQKSSSFIPPVPKPTINSAPHFQPVQQKATPNPVVQKKSSTQQQIAGEKAMWDNMCSGLQVQAKCAKCGGEEANHSPTQIAATGFTGSPVALPHLDRIQRSFGQDLSHVQAYIGGPATAASKQLGAQAYTMGNKIAFQKPPSVELAAHEGTHVVQQQSGKVQLAGEMGKVGDKYEVEADAVGAKVAAGESVQPLLKDYQKNTSSIPDNNSFVAKKEDSQSEQAASRGNEEQLIARGGTYRRIVAPQHPGWADLKSGYLGPFHIPGEPVELPHTLKVTLLTNEGDVRRIKIHEGYYKDKKAKVSTDQLGHYLNPNSSAQVTWTKVKDFGNVWNGQFNFGSFGPISAHMDATNPIPSGTYDLEIPDYQHSLGAAYGNYATTWFRIGNSGDRYLHPGMVSQGCVTVVNTEHWEQIWAYLIQSRKDSRSVGRITIKNES